MSGVDFVHIHAHAFHHVDAVAEREDNAFLGGAHDVVAAMDVEIDAMHGAARFLVLHDTLGSVAERNDAEAFAAHGHALGHAVHLFVAVSFGYDIAAHP